MPFTKPTVFMGLLKPVLTLTITASNCVLKGIHPLEKLQTPHTHTKKVQ